MTKALPSGTLQSITDGWRGMGGGPGPQINTQQAER